MIKKKVDTEPPKLEEILFALIQFCGIYCREKKNYNVYDALVKISFIIRGSNLSCQRTVNNKIRSSRNGRFQAIFEDI